MGYATAQETPVNEQRIPPVEETPTTEDPIKLNKDQVTELEPAVKDSTKPRGLLEFKLESNAKGYMITNRRNNTLTLYDEAIIVYGDIRLEAGKIIVDNNTGNVFAYGIVEDSTGAYVQKPVFTQGTNKIEPDSIIFNKDTKKALTYNSKTAQGEFNVVAEVTKKVNDSVFFMKNARFTTSSNPENPEYYFLARKIKFVPKKKIVTGLVNMYIANVPTPLGLPFAFFPMTTERRSGIILPSFGNNNNQGYFLQNGGYYFAINDYVDLTVMGDYFTNGSYGARVESSYRKRYKYSGSLRFLLEEQIQSERGFSDFRQTGRYNINWQHSQDANASPNSRFSASVNLGSPDFYRNSFNQTNQSATLINNLSSSISYSKTFPGEPQVNLNTTVSVNQNVNTNTTQLTLPTFQGSVSRVFPFASKTGVKKGIIQNINVQYNLRGENRATTTNDNLFSADIFADAQAGLKHTIPISTNFKVAKYFSVSAGANFEENWVFETFDQTLVPTDAGSFEVRRDTISGFDSYRTYNFSASLGTTIYGSFTNSNKEAKIQAVRHVMRPSLSYTINPSFDQYYERLELENGDVLTSQEERFFSRFQNTLFGAPGRVFSSNLGISLQNLLEAKVIDPEDEEGKLKKVQWIKSLNFSTSYNLAGDSLQLSPLSISGVIPVYKNVDLQINANLDPYALDAENNRIDTFNYENGGSFFRLTNAGARFNFKLDSKDFDGSKKEDEETGKVENTTLRNGGRADDLFGEPIDPLEATTFDEDDGLKEDVNLDENLYNFKIPWSLNVAYTFAYNNAARQNQVSGNSLMLSGDVEFSPRWSIGGSTGYDFVGNGISFTTIRFQRDLESFRMSFNWNPIGPNNSWFFFIGIKSGALSDIKYDQRKQPDLRF